MNDSWLDEYCLAKDGATKEYKKEWKATRYLIGGKMFALHGADKTARPIITLKLLEQRALELRLPGWLRAGRCAAGYD
ncbi:MmcQ/YjbR family DNA-binding protein [Paenibacillaceae bacterium WGS1546]|uniref:MmcQ/YjbR family DNA-binding protein n=1 Tax=Cohnella sp. WGS1546 TaxID=3366810 RepID=UPI00372D1BE1